MKIIITVQNNTIKVKLHQSKQSSPMTHASSGDKNPQVHTPRTTKNKLGMPLTKHPVVRRVARSVLKQPAIYDHKHTLMQLRRTAHAPICKGGSWEDHDCHVVPHGVAITTLPHATFHDTHTLTLPFCCCLDFDVWSLHKQKQLVLDIRRQTVDVLCLVQFAVH